MEAVEFEAIAKNGIIIIPKKYKDMANSKLKIILLKEEKEYLDETKDLLELVTQIKEEKIFSKIDKPENWQSEIRSEW